MKAHSRHGFPLARTAARTAATVLAAGISVALLAGCATNEAGDLESDLVGTLDSAGSSAQSAAQDVWIAEFQHNNSRVTINYDPAGSGAGREQFIAGGIAFAGSDAALSDEELAGTFGSCATGSSAIDLPVYVSPLALVYRVDGVDSLQLDSAAIAGIFSATITRWNDPALVALNPDETMPDAAITAVHRADSSGTTKNFTDYLHDTAATAWPSEASDDFPYAGGEAAQGNSGVVAAVNGGVNTIGYADASRSNGLPAASILVGDEFVAHSAAGAAAIIDASPLEERANDHDIVVDIDRTSTAAGVYPMVLVSYLIACETYADAADAEIVKAYLGFVASDAGQALAADGAGSAALSADFSSRVREAIASIG
jgi:phosphate transport system substrate-binding protein